MKRTAWMGILLPALLACSQALAQKHDQARQDFRNVYGGTGAPPARDEKFINRSFYVSDWGAQPNNSAVIIPTRFPYQVEFDFNSESFPAALPNGQILYAWISRDTIYCAVSSDNGQSWNTPIVIKSGGFFLRHLAGKRTTTGRILVVWVDGSVGLTMSFSDNNGLSWSAAVTITTNPSDRLPTLTQTLDGRLWLFYSRTNNTTASDIFFRTSIDNGASWSEEQVFAATAVDELYGTVISGNGATLLAIYEEGTNDDSDYNIFLRTSTNGGLTWSAPSPVVNSSLSEVRPRVLRQPDGKLWLIYQLFNPTPSGRFQYDIYSTTSTNGGISWTTPERFTTYAGYDGFHNVDLLSNNQPFVSFASHRWATFWLQPQIGYGIIGATSELNPPPALLDVRYDVPRQNIPLAVQAYVEDETGISAVNMFYRLDGVLSGPLQMFDDGAHADFGAGDHIWGASAGPFRLGDVVNLSFSITDVTSNTVNFSTSTIELVPMHDVGNVILSFHANSQLADEGLVEGTGAHWPRDNGNDYLYQGGLWVAANVAGENRVMNLHYSSIDWSRTFGAPVLLAPGISTQDGEVTYDDAKAESPPLGVQILQKSYQWSAPTRDDFVIFQYQVTNTGQNGNLSQVHLALWLDPDHALNGTYNDDLGGYDSQRRLIYTYDSQNNPGGYLGVKMLGAGTVPFTARVFAPSDPRDDNERFQFMTAGIVPPPTAPNDVRILITAPPFDLAAGQSRTVAFGLLLGNGLAELQAHADTMAAIYDGVVVGVREGSSSADIPRENFLRQNYPNPFNPSTLIQFGLSKKSQVKLEIFNTLGQTIATLVDRELAAGKHEAKWEAANAQSGIYFYRLQTRDFVEIKKLILLR
jgi:hypothetical protein